MGEIADAMLEGEMCEGCGEFFFDEASGYPRRCSGCGGEDTPKPSGRSAGKRRRARAKRQRKAQQNRERLAAQDPAGWTQHTEYHWSKTVCGLRFDYWPSTAKAMFNGQVFKNVEDINELEKTITKGMENGTP